MYESYSRIFMTRSDRKRDAGSVNKTVSCLIENITIQQLFSDVLRQTENKETKNSLRLSQINKLNIL